MQGLPFMRWKLHIYRGMDAIGLINEAGDIIIGISSYSIVIVGYGTRPFKYLIPYKNLQVCGSRINALCILSSVVLL